MLKFKFVAGHSKYCSSACFH